MSAGCRHPFTASPPPSCSPLHLRTFAPALDEPRSPPSPTKQQLRAQLELLQNHDTSASSAATAAAAGAPDSSAAASRSPLSRPANGYEDLAAASHDAARALAAKSEAEAHIHPDLRGLSSQRAPTPSMLTMAAPAGHSAGATAGPAPVAPIAVAPQPLSPDQDSAEGRKAKRELSQSKRAAQNRAAQRAFRQRKEGYIKKLELQVREYGEMEQTFKLTQSENYVLREYVVHLQSRLLDVQGEYPPPPPNINLAQPQPAAAQPSAGATPEQATSQPSAEAPLEAVAQAVAGLAAQEQLENERKLAYANSRADEDMRSAEEINRQLESAADGLPRV
ncbi:transmembrane protein [Drechmeria coniospora]|uniref:Putative transcription factor kapC n=1 Tax=Drechmeria coniospora TaxID=98403 RepID=A0A151GQU9_DRECN|nr:transmembrane protein [Drechmeria coniospora]KYK59476.1 transmembrane protein [Drechmeria coniospora]